MVVTDEVQGHGKLQPQLHKHLQSLTQGTPGTVFHVRMLGFIEIFGREQRLTDGDYQ